MVVVYCGGGCINGGGCYNFEQLKQLLTVAFHKEVAFRVEFKV